MSAATLFPAFLDLRGRRCLVVGGGEIARQKIAGLLPSGAHIHVVAPEACAEVRRLAEDGRLRWWQRTYSAGDLEGAYLVIAATGEPRVNEAVFAEAERRGALCNSVDDPEHCHFQCPAVVRRGELQIAISTGGRSPALAQRLRAELEAQFSPEYAPWLEWLGRVRQLMFRTGVGSQQRKRALHKIASRDVYNRFRAAWGGRQGRRDE